MENKKLLTIFLCGLSFNLCSNLLIATETKQIKCDKGTNVCVNEGKNKTETNCSPDRKTMTLDAIAKVLDRELKTSGKSVNDLQIYDYYDQINALLDYHLSENFSDDCEKYAQNTKEILEFILCARRFCSGDLKSAFFENLPTQIVLYIMADLFRALSIWSEELADQCSDSALTAFVNQELDAYEQWLIELK